MTGQYAHNHGVQSNIPGVTLDEFVQRETIQKRLHSNGYTTAYYGKFLNRWALHKDPNYFDTYALADVGDKASDTRYYNTPFAVKDEGEDGYHEEFADGYVTDYLGDAAVDFIDSHRDTPWLMILAPTAPHAPYVPESIYRNAWVGQWPVNNKAVWERDRSDKPPYVRKYHVTPSRGRYIRAQQLRSLMSVDDVIERTFATLRRIGESQDTLALYTPDNGYMWGDHGLVAKDVPYTPAVKVKMFARWPSAIPPGSVDRRLVANIDIAPTALVAAGLDPEGTDGRDLLDPSWARERILLEHWCNVNACNRWAATRTKGHQYVEYYDADGRTTFREYYDLRRDPWQLRNLLHDRVRANNPDWGPLAEQLAADRSCAGGSCP
jgi:arylsulfatase A-like enzyme